MLVRRVVQMNVHIERYGKGTHPQRRVWLEGGEDDPELIAACVYKKGAEVVATITEALIKCKVSNTSCISLSQVGDTGSGGVLCG